MGGRGFSHACPVRLETHLVLLHAIVPSILFTMWANPPGTWQRTSQLEFLVTRVTTAAQPDNNYALHIEIAEYINKKKANRYILILMIRRHVKPIWAAQSARSCDAHRSSS